MKEVCSPNYNDIDILHDVELKEMFDDGSILVTVNDFEVIVDNMLVNLCINEKNNTLDSDSVVKYDSESITDELDEVSMHNISLDAIEIYEETIYDSYELEFSDSPVNMKHEYYSAFINLQHIINYELMNQLRKNINDNEIDGYMLDLIGEKSYEISKDIVYGEIKEKIKEISDGFKVEK